MSNPYGMSDDETRDLRGPWRHVKSNVLYRFMHVATDANNDAPRSEQQVVYIRIKDDAVFVRSLSEFLSSFERYVK